MLLRCTLLLQSQSQPMRVSLACSKNALHGCESQPASSTAGLDALVSDHKANCEGSLGQLIRESEQPDILPSLPY